MMFHYLGSYVDLVIGTKGGKNKLLLNYEHPSINYILLCYEALEILKL